MTDMDKLSYGFIQQWLIRKVTYWQFHKRDMSSFSVWKISWICWWSCAVVSRCALPSKPDTDHAWWFKVYNISKSLQYTFVRSDQVLNTIKIFRKGTLHCLSMTSFAVLRAVASLHIWPVAGTDSKRVSGNKLLLTIIRFMFRPRRAMCTIKHSVFFSGWVSSLVGGKKIWLI